MRRPNFVPGPYRVRDLRGGPAIVARCPEGVDPNAPDEMLRVGVATHIPGIDEDVERATMFVMAAGPELFDLAESALGWIDAVPEDVASALPPMPGFSRDWADQVLMNALGHGFEDELDASIPDTGRAREVDRLKDLLARTASALVAANSGTQPDEETSALLDEVRGIIGIEPATDGPSPRATS